MPLDEQIAQYTNPQEFTRLCNAVLTAFFPDDYQAIDGSRADAGNDGYLRSAQRIYAIYCPAKPVRRSDADYLKKARDDFNKALKIRDAGQLKVDAWSFVTPEKLSHDVIVALEREVAAKGLKFSHIEASYLAGALLKHSHLIKDFPGLHISRLEELLQKAKESEPKPERHARVAEQKAARAKLPGVGSDAKGQKRIRELAQGFLKPESKAELRTLVYGSPDPEVQVNAVIALCNGYEPADDNADDLTTLCEYAAPIASHLGDGAAEGFLLGMVGRLQSFKHSLLDVEVWGSDQADAAIGMVLTAPEDRARKVQAMRHMKDKYTAAFSRAFEVTKDHPAGYAAALTLLGTAAGERAGYIKHLGDREGAANEFATSKGALLRAKAIFASIGDLRNSYSAMLNLANQIRFHGELGEAKALA